MDARGIIFHYFEDEHQYQKCQGSVDAETLASMIRYLRKHYTLLDAADYLDFALRRKLKEDYVCLTFDDGVKSQIGVAWDVMKAENVTGFFFAYSSHFEGAPSMLEIYHDFRFSAYRNVDAFYADFMDKLMEMEDAWKKDIRRAVAAFDPKTYLIHSKCHTDSDRLFRYLRDCVLTADEYNGIMAELMKARGYRAEQRVNQLWMDADDLKTLLQGGNIIGLHSHTHPTTMYRRSYAEQLEEYRKNQKVLEAVVGCSATTASYPSGSFNDDTDGIMERLGIQIGFQANMVDHGGSLYRLRRSNHTDLLNEMKEKGGLS